MATKKSDLYVITKVKELTRYVITITEKSPKKFRFTLVARLQNYCLDSLEQIVLANMLPITAVMPVSCPLCALKINIVLQSLGDWCFRGSVC